MSCYGFILFKAAVLIGEGSEKLLLIYGPGIVGGLLIPILGAIPDGAIVLVSGLGNIPFPFLLFAYLKCRMRWTENHNMFLIQILMQFILYVQAYCILSVCTFR